MSKQALIVWGGWNGHEPEQVAGIFDEILKGHGFETEVSTTLDSFLDVEKLKTLDLIVPVWTMGTLTGEQEKAVCAAVESGVGIGGCHGGMCDSFRNSVTWQFMTGGQWVSHPGNDGVEYTVKITDKAHFVTKTSSDFTVKSEQYYMHCDPGLQVQATCEFPVADGPHSPNGKVQMPQVWTKMWGEGRVFYTALGHKADVVAQKEVREICTRGLLWAAKAEERVK